MGVVRNQVYDHLTAWVSNKSKPSINPKALSSLSPTCSHMKSYSVFQTNYFVAYEIKLNGERT